MSNYHGNPFRQFQNDPPMAGHMGNSEAAQTSVEEAGRREAKFEAEHEYDPAYGDDGVCAGCEKAGEFDPRHNRTPAEWLEEVEREITHTHTGKVA